MWLLEYSNLSFTIKVLSLSAGSIMILVSLCKALIANISSLVIYDLGDLSFYGACFTF